ncbi:hypothetical protein ACFYYB_11500 [Streptomyces sp. NPDC002886]|uniref:hypothetical protein n=1 Tax=Streptomyces sp. NPDC002886 TaxID=3364667 RepID=UPI0036B3FEC1
MPVEYTRVARTALGGGGLLAVTQLCVLGRDRADTAAPARTVAAAALPNRRDLLRGLGYEDPDALGRRLVDALVVHGGAESIADRVQEHFDAGADHVSLHLVTTGSDSPSGQEWERLATHLIN